MPNIFVIAGPNGAGKSTAAPLLIGQRLGILPIADSWEMHDNSLPPLRTIASREGVSPIRVSDRALWEAIEERMRASEKEGEYDAGIEPKLMGVPVSEVIAIFNQAGREAMARHKALGHPIVIWRDGKVVVVPPEDIEV